MGLGVAGRRYTRRVRENQEPTKPAPARLSWEQAALALPAMISARRRVRSPVLVGVSGAVGSGKSTLADRLGGVVVRTDDYLPDYAGLPEHERDLPDRADLGRLRQDLEALARGDAVKVPVWCFHEHRRTGERLVEPGAVIVCEGIHALHERVSGMYDIRVFVEAPRAVRWARWEAIEASNERGWGVDRAREFFEGVAEPTFDRFAPMYRASAHVLVINDRWTPAKE